MRSARIIFYGALVFSVVVVVAALRFSGAGPEPSGAYHLQAVVLDAQSLTPGGDVRIAGLQVGKIDAIGQRGNAAVLELTLEKEYAPVREDARVGVRLRTLVGENYVELYPGSAGAPALPENGVLPLDQTIEQPQIDQILSTLDAPTRRDARRLLRGTGEGLAGEGENLNRTIAGLTGTVERIQPVSAVLDRQRTQTARLIDNLGAIMRTVGARGADIRSMATRSRQTFTALAERDEALRQVLDELPSTLDQVTTTTGILRDITATSAPVVEQLATDTAALRPAVDALGPAAAATRLAIDELGRAADPLRGVLVQLRQTSRTGSGMLPKLAAALRQLNPAAAYLSPYAKEVTAFFSSMRSATNYFDATGHAARVHLVVSHTSPTLYDDQTREIVDKLLDSGVIGTVRATKYSAYQQPGTMTDPSKFDSRTFERVRAEKP
jgi:phospholipid/cholesterol/gamma-HCH transport system substrate-binding protein